MAELSHKEAAHQNKQMYSDCIDSDVKEVLNELVDKTSHETRVQENGESLKADQASNISDFVEMGGTSSETKNEDSSDVEELQHFSKQGISKKRIRSVSESESESDTKAKEINRRKFGSEGAIFSICENIIPQEQRKELNEAIEQYIEKIIKDSIFKAVKRVSVDSLYESIINDLSGRKNSVHTESESDFIVEQRLASNSISELVELENTAESNDGKRTECSYSLLPGDSDKVSKPECLDNEFDDGTFVGYLADMEDTGSMDDFNSLNSSIASNSEQKGVLSFVSQECSEKSQENINQTELSAKDPEKVNRENADSVTATEVRDSIPSTEINTDQQHSDQQNQPLQSASSSCEPSKDSVQDLEPIAKIPPQERFCEQELNSVTLPKSEENAPTSENSEKQSQVLVSSEKITENIDLIVMSPEEECIFQKNDSNANDISVPPPDITDNLPQQNVPVEEQTKINWKVGCLHVKLPHKTRGKAHLKAWRKRRVIIQPDEFVNDPKNPSLVISVYGHDAKKHETTFWHSVSSLKAVVFRSSSRTHRYAFTISDGGEPIIHLSGDRESTSQEWMAAIRAVLWPPSPFMELEKMLSGREFEISIIDNEYSYHAGLLGMYGYLSITPKKLILLHPQQGYVIQEWYLNTVDKFQFVPQPKSEDMHKVICMTTCSDSSTGHGEIVIFCNEAVTFLQSLASNIHQVLSYHSKQEGGKYRKELEEIAEWLVAPPQDCLSVDDKSDEHYKVPPRQVKSLLDIPNFIFNKSLSPVASAIYPAPNTDILEPLDGTKNKPTTTSHDSGISTCTSGDDFLNCSVTSFVLGGGPMTGKSSDSELSDAYTPPRTPETQKKTRCEVQQEEQPKAGEA